MHVGYEFHQKLTSPKFMASSALKSFGTVFFFVPVFLCHHSQILFGK